MQHRHAAAAWTLLLTILLAVPAGAATTVDRSRIYHGDPTDFERPVCVRADDVYRQIPAYRQILERGLERTDPRYWVLINRANAVFTRALEQAELDHDYDLVGEVGAIKVDGRPAPDVTGKVLAIVRRLVRHARQATTVETASSASPVPASRRAVSR